MLIILEINQGFSFIKWFRYNMDINKAKSEPLSKKYNKF